MVLGEVRTQMTGEFDNFGRASLEFRAARFELETNLSKLETNN